MNILSRMPQFEALSRNAKRIIMGGTDFVLLPIAFWSAIALRYATWSPDVGHVWWLFLLTPCIALPIFAKLGLYRAVIRYMEDKVIYTVLLGVTLSVVLLLAVIAMAHVEGVPRSSIVFYWVLAVLYISTSRFLARGYLQNISRAVGNAVPVVIYGADPDSMQLGLALRAGKDYLPVAFIDDRQELRGGEIGGIKINPVESLPMLVERQNVSQILLAMPSASRARRREIIDQLEPYKLQIKIVPGIADLVSGQIAASDIREVEIEDLLGRDPVQPDEHLLTRCIVGKTVMVTGAGGSIGSELCRQILSIGPQQLVLFERSEFALYQIEQELQSVISQKGLDVKLVAILGSVNNRAHQERVMQTFNVQTVYHAAAYKHVPLVEFNIVEGVRNNVFGTLHTAQAAVASGVETFVLISTDKAVRPTNAMGASKRLAELVLQALSRQGGATRFCMVRFGNVLGSSGSVVPLFRSQIRKGGPITLTHPEITRYFMTIPEAAQLVLQAGSIGQGGDVFVLDMGEPVRILDLARRMVHLSGLEVRDEHHPDGDIEIRITGLRPGEKLYEELLIGDNVEGTQHPLIMRAQEIELPMAQLTSLLERLNHACRTFDCPSIRALLQESVTGYSPKNDIDDHVWRASQAFSPIVTEMLH